MNQLRCFPPINCLDKEYFLKLVCNIRCSLHAPTCIIYIFTMYIYVQIHVIKIWNIITIYCGDFLLVFFFLQFNLPEIFGNSKQLFMNGTNYSYPQFLFIFGFFKMFRGFLHDRKNCKSGIQNYDLVWPNSPLCI